MMSFGKIEITTEKEEIIPGKKGEVYVGMEHVDNYQKARSVKVGIGAMYGDKPQQPPKEGTPGSVPVDNGTKDPNGNSNGGLDPRPSDNPGDNGNNQNP